MSQDPMPQSLKEFLTLESVAETFGVSKAVVCTWRDRLGMPVIKLDSRRTIVHEATLAAWLKARERARVSE
jgi:hypothetical protein